MNKPLEILIDQVVSTIDDELYKDYYNSKTAIISEDEVESERDVLRDILEPILDDSEFLKILRQNGVEDWEGYEDAVEVYGKPIYYE